MSIQVAVAVITDEQQRILITKRAMHSSHGGMWEFPGGKLEDNELAPAALIREIKEEVGLAVMAYEYLGEIHHIYKDQPITLLIYHVSKYQGSAVCREAQMDMCWVKIEHLSDFQFPPANIKIIDLISPFIANIQPNYS